MHFIGSQNRFIYLVFCEYHSSNAVKIHADYHLTVDLLVSAYRNVIFHSLVIFILAASFSKMINLSQPDTIDERVINTKKLTTFKMTVSPAPLKHVETDLDNR